MKTKNEVKKIVASAWAHETEAKNEKEFQQFLELLRRGRKQAAHKLGRRIVAEHLNAQ